MRNTAAKGSKVYYGIVGNRSRAKGAKLDVQARRIEKRGESISGLSVIVKIGIQLESL